MNLINSLLKKSSISGFLINSLPKGGTHLLEKTVTLFPEIHSKYIHMGQSTLSRFKQTVNQEAITVPIGVDWPHPVLISSVQQYLSKLKSKKGYYTTAHIPFSEVLANLQSEMEMKSLLILRDPRDVVVSHAKYVGSNPKHFLFKLYQSLSESERIMKSIVGIQKIAADSPTLLNIHERCYSVIPWTLQSLNYTTYFEKLVGIQGGGSHDAQIEELENIARHLGINNDSYDIEQVASQIFGGTDTFRKGKIGSWENNFSEEHKSAFKNIAGELLIKLGYEKSFDW